MPPYVRTVSGASTAIPGFDQRTELSISGEFIQQNFKYRNQLFLTGALRSDGSSVFGPNQRNQVYSKLSGSYVLSGTDYWDKLGVSKWWDLFKVRAAYGESGNLTGIPAYGRFNTYTASAFVGSSSFEGQTTYTNPNLKPERQKELEIGTDLSFLKNLIGVNSNYYHKRVENLLISKLIAPTNGYSSLLDNICSFQNNEYKVVLNPVPLRTKNLHSQLTSIYNHNQKKALNIRQSLLLFITNAVTPVPTIAVHSL